MAWNWLAFIVGFAIIILIISVVGEGMIGQAALFIQGAVANLYASIFGGFG